MSVYVCSLGANKAANLIFFVEVERRTHFTVEVLRLLMLFFTLLA